MMVAAERAPWQNPRILSTLALVFLAGAAAGALTMQVGIHGRMHRSTSAAPEATNREAILSRFKTQLDLSGPQTEQLGMVLDDFGQYYQSLEEQLDDLRATGKTRIIAILNPEQREKFEKMMTDLAPELAPH